MKTNRFVVLAGAGLLLACSCSKGKPSGGDFYKLEAAGIAYETPAGWQVVDPPLRHDDIVAFGAGALRYGFSLIFVQPNIAVAAFYPDDRTAVVVACQGPSRPYNGSDANPLEHAAGTEWEEHWWDETNNPLLRDKQEGTIALGDGTALPFKRSRMLPGALAGDDVVQVIAAGEVKGRYLAIGASARFEDDATGPALEEHVRRIAAALRVEGDAAPSAIDSPE